MIEISVGGAPHQAYLPKWGNSSMDTVNVKNLLFKKFEQCSMIEKSSFPLKNKVNLILLDFTKISQGFRQYLIRSSPRFYQDFTGSSPGSPPGVHQKYTGIPSRYFMKKCLIDSRNK